MAEWIERTIDALGYPGIAFLTFLESLFPPLPSEVVMPLAGFTAARGELSFPGVVLAGAAGSLAGTLVFYYLGRRFGDERLKRWADRYGAWVAVSRADIELAEAWFDRHCTKAVFFLRMMPAIRSLISIPAGIARMSLPTFLLFSGLGMGLWSAVLASLGYLLGENYYLVDRYVSGAGYLVLAAIAAGTILWVWKRRKQAASPRGDRSGASRRVIRSSGGGRRS